MNIFYLDHDPRLAAQYQCDKHIIKMILESAQLLCTVHHELKMPIPEGGKIKFYRATHRNHPCAIWARKSRANYWWLCKHAVGLCSEYTYRYGKIHASTAVILYCMNNIPPVFEQEKMSSLAQAMPPEFKNDDPVQAYRDYYWFEKRKTIQMRWTRRPKPDWWLRLEALEDLTAQAQELNMGY